MAPIHTRLWIYKLEAVEAMMMYDFVIRFFHSICICKLPKIKYKPQWHLNFKSDYQGLSLIWIVKVSSHLQSILDNRSIKTAMLFKHHIFLFYSLFRPKFYLDKIDGK